MEVLVFRARAVILQLAVGCGEALALRNHRKMTGVTISTWARELTIPPRTGVASGRITSDPTRVLQKIGNKPATMVETVMSFGRRRRSAPSMTRFAQMRDGESAVLELCSLHGFFEVDHHDDRCLHPLYRRAR